MFKITESRFGNNVSTDENKCSVLVESAADLANIPTDVAPGSTAYTADYTSMWCKGLDGAWHAIGGDS